MKFVACCLGCLAVASGSLLKVGVNVSRHALNVTYREDRSFEENLEISWEQFINDTRITDLLNEDELARFHTRFLAHFSTTTKEDKEGMRELFANFVQEALMDEEPAITEYEVNGLNKMISDWTAGIQDWEKDISMKGFKKRLGLKTEPLADYEEGGHTVLEDAQDAAQEETVVEDTKENEPDEVLLQVHVDGVIEKFKESNTSLLEENTRAYLPSQFDPRKNKWSKCAAVINHIRDQGGCGSCWAQAGVSAIEVRACIKTGHKLWVSAAYATSCAKNPFGSDGCQGNDGRAALHLAMNGGIPTGGNHKSNIGCVPYFTSNGALQHFDGWNGVTPGCPRSCNGNYPRALANDKVTGPSGGGGFGTFAGTSASNNAQAAKQEMYTNGPIVLGYAVYSDFMAYRSGVYVPTSRAQQGGHAVMCFGWGSSRVRHLTCANSWGKEWGEQGRFSIQEGCCEPNYYWGPISAAKAMPGQGGGGGDSGNKKGKKNDGNKKDNKKKGKDEDNEGTGECPAAKGSCTTNRGCTCSKTTFKKVELENEKGQRCWGCREECKETSANRRRRRRKRR